MAKIILNAKLNLDTADAKKQIGELGKALSSSISGGKSGKGGKSIVNQFNDLRKGYANLANQIKNVQKYYKPGTFNDVTKAIDANIEVLKQFGETGKYTKRELNALGVQLKKLQANFAISKKDTESTKRSIFDIAKGYANLANQIKNVQKYYKSGTFDEITKEINQTLGVLNQLMSTGNYNDNQLDEFSNSLKRLGANFAIVRNNTESTKGSLSDIVKGFLKFQIAAKVVMIPLQALTKAWQELNETVQKTEDAVIALQRVLPAGSASDKDVSARLYGLARQYGQTFENVSEIATNFARTGMDWAETIKATEAALLALNVAELDSTEASDGLIAIMTQFGMTASDLTGIVDKLNKTADNFPVTSEKLLLALQRTGSAASNANLSLDQTIGLVTALSKATGRSGENLGTAINSLIQYSSKNTALDTFAGLSSNASDVVGKYRAGAASILDVWRAVSKEIQNISSEQADMLDAYFNTADGSDLKTQLSEELSGVYDELGGVYDTANTFRKNYFIALLKNIDTVDEAIKTSSDALGYSQEENEKYLDTYTAKVNSLKAAWQDLLNNEAFLDFKKGLVDVGNFLVKALQWTGGLRTVLIAISGTLLTITSQKIISGIKSIRDGFISLKTALTGAASAAATLQAALGIITLVTTAISALIGVLEQINRENEEARQKSIDKWKEEKENAIQLAALYKEYENATERNEAFFETEKRIVELLGEKKGVLEGLTNGTDEYSRAVENLTNKEINLYLADAISAKNNALKGLKNANKTFNFSTDQELNVGDLFQALADSKEDPFAIYNKIIELRQDAADRLSNAILSGNSEEEQTQQKRFDAFEKYFEHFRKYVDDYKTAEESLQKFNNALKNGAETQEQITKSVETWSKRLEDVRDRYDDIADALAKLRDEEEKSVEWEERKKAVMEAERDLAEAQRQRSVRVLENGTWTWRANQKDVQTAQEKLEQARTNLQKNAYNSMIDELKSGNATTESILRILDDVTLVLNDDGTFSARVKDVFKNNGVNLSRDATTRGYTNVADSTDTRKALTDRQRARMAEKVDRLMEGQLYDNGGILSGLGGIKATSRNEAVLDPKLTAEILNPVSNTKFAQFANSLGLLFGASKSIPSDRGSIVNQNTSNDSHNSYSVNGVPIPQRMAETQTLVQIFQNMDLVHGF